MPITPESFSVDTQGIPMSVTILEADGVTYATPYHSEDDGGLPVANPFVLAGETTLYFASSGDGVRDPNEPALADGVTATPYLLSCMFSATEVAGFNNLPLPVEARSGVQPTYTISVGDTQPELATVLVNSHRPLTPVDDGVDGDQWVTVVQGAFAPLSLPGSYFKGTVRTLETNPGGNPPSGWLIDGWGKLQLSAGDTGPLVIDFANLIARNDIGNEFRGVDGMPIGHAAGTLAGAPAEYLHLVLSPDDGPCACRIISLSGEEFATALMDGDELHFQFSANTWSD